MRDATEEAITYMLLTRSSSLCGIGGGWCSGAPTRGSLGCVRGAPWGFSKRGCLRSAVYDA
eukprot:1233442-Pyramimonas_sp.AAC.1